MKEGGRKGQKETVGESYLLLKWRKGSGPEECRQPPDAGKGEKMDSPLQHEERN